MPLLQSSGVAQLNDQKRNGTYRMQEGGAMSSILALVRTVKEKVQPTTSTDMAERVPDTTEVGKTSKKSVSVER